MGPALEFGRVFPRRSGGSGDIANTFANSVSVSVSTDRAFSGTVESANAAACPAPHIPASPGRGRRPTGRRGVRDPGATYTLYWGYPDWPQSISLVVLDIVSEQVD